MNGTANVSVTISEKEESILNSTDSQLVEIIVKVGLTGLVCAIGIPANICNCLVFRRQGLQDRMNLCLFALSLTDLAYLILMCVLYPVSYLIDIYDKIAMDVFYTSGYLVITGICYSLRATSGFITMVIAVERCGCVVFPLRASSCMKTRIMAGILFTIFLLLQLSYITMPLSNYIAIMNITGSKKRVYSRSKFYMDNPIFIDTFIHTILGFALPTTVVLIVSTATAITVIKLKTSIRWREKTSSINSSTSCRQRTLTVMLVMVACVYTGTMLPLVAREIFIRFWSSVIINFGYYDLFMSVTVVVDWIPQINSSVHCFIYYTRSSLFRLHFNYVLRKLRLRVLKSESTNDSNFTF